MLEQPSTRKIVKLSVLTGGLYLFYWCSKSRQEVNASAKQQLVPTTWLLAVPLLNYYWVWLYGNALQTTTYGRIKQADVILLFIIATGIGSPFVVFNIPSDDVSKNTVTYLIIAFLVLLILASAFTSAFFCSTIQAKINRSIKLKTR